MKLTYLQSLVYSTVSCLQWIFAFIWLLNTCTKPYLTVVVLKLAAENEGR